MSGFMSGVSLDGELMVSGLKNGMSVHQIWLIVLVEMGHRLRVVIKVIVPKSGVLTIVVSLANLIHFVLRLGGSGWLLVTTFFVTTLFV